MRIDRRLAALLATLLVGCSYGYRASGQFAGNPEILAGSVQHSFAGGARFGLHGASGLACEGHAEPPTSPGRDGACTGEGGSGTMRCNDGRRFAIAWEATSCRSFRGSGRDAAGNVMEFAVRRP